MIFRQVIIVLGTLSFACGSPMDCITRRQNSLKMCVADQGLLLSSSPIQHGLSKFCRQQDRYVAAIECAINVIKEECVPLEYWHYASSSHKVIQKMAHYLCTLPKLDDFNKTCVITKALDFLHCMGNATGLCSFLKHGEVCLKTVMHDCGLTTGNFFVALTNDIYSYVCAAVDIHPEGRNAGNGLENREHSKVGDPDNTRDNNGDSKDGDPDNTRGNYRDSNQDTGGSKGTATQSAASSAGLLTATSVFLAYCHIFM